MARNLPASKRGWGYDPLTKTLDIHVDGVINTKMGGVAPPLSSTDTTQLYAVGTRLVVDERVFRYAMVGDCTGDAATWAAGYGRTCEYGVGMSSTTRTIVAATKVSGALNSFEVVITLSENIAADGLQGGYFGIKTSSNVTVWGCRIAGNTVATSGDETTITLESPLPIVYSGIGTISLTASPYANVVRHSGAGGHCKEAVVGLLMVYAAAPGADLEDKYVWLQTWGPFSNPQIATTHEGDGDMERTLWFSGGGAMQCYTSNAEHVAKQVAGFYATEYASAGKGYPVVWLTIAP